MILLFFFFSSRRRHTRYIGDWSSDVCSSDLQGGGPPPARVRVAEPAADLRLDRLQFVFGGALPAGHAALAGRAEAVQRHRRSEERRVGKEGRRRWTGVE